MSLSTQNLVLFCKLTSSSGQVVSAANPCCRFGSNTCLFCLREASLSFRPIPVAPFEFPSRFPVLLESLLKDPVAQTFCQVAFRQVISVCTKDLLRNLALLWARAGIVFFSSFWDWIFPTQFFVSFWLDYTVPEEVWEQAYDERFPMNSVIHL